MLIAKVEPGSGAAKAGLRGGSTQVTVAGESYVVGGDVIVRIEGEAVSSLARLRDLVASKKPGDTVALSIYRSSGGGWKRLTLHVKLGNLPS